MSALIDRIAAVQRKHLYTATPVSVRDPRMLRCICGTEVKGLEGHAAHVAERVAEALNLTEETREQPWEIGISTEVLHVRRWVSPWVAVEDNQPEEKS